MTARKQIEAGLKESHVRLQHAAAAADAANRAKDQFLAMLSHELRTPLAPVLLGAECLESDQSLHPRIRDEIRMIRQSVELETRLIDDLLDLTRITHGKLELHKRVVDVHAAVRHALEICRRDLSAKRLDLRVDLLAAQSHALADAARVEQVVWNLLHNAVKFTPEDGRIGIRSYNRSGTRDTPPADQRLIIEIRDNGVGIDPAMIPKLFSAFEQGAPDITRRFGGLGLGLSICKGLVEGHGGVIWADSPGRGKGATFIVELPVVPAPAEPPERADEGPPQARRPSLRILLVEDHEHTARVVARLLEAMGHKVRTASDVASALAAGGSQDFDLVISDLGLPDGSGLDLMRKLSQERGLGGIALSGYGMEEDIRRSLAAGFSKHLIKPVNAHQLERAINEFAAERPQQGVGCGDGEGDQSRDRLS